MTFFAQPAFLLLLLAVPLLVWWWLRRRRPALRYSDLRLLTDVPTGRTRLARWGSIALRTAALVVLILALAGVRWPDQSSPIPAEGIAVVMLLDVSGSMAEPFGEWQGEPINRLDAAKKAFHLFIEGGQAPDGEQLEGRGSDLVGLVAFARRPETVCPLTLSHSVLLRLLDAEEPRPQGESETNISDAVVIGLDRLESAPTRRKVLVLLSDGEHNVPHPESGWTPRQAAQVAANLGIPIYTIDASGELADLSPDGAPGRKTLRAIAEITQGKSFEAQDAAGLLRVCREIDALEKQEIQSFHRYRYYPLFAWFGLTALGLLVTGHLLELTAWQKLP
jgi:Ca-activated chloride channel family protein